MGFSPSAVSAAINGGSLKDNLEAGILNALIKTGHGAAASQIKTINGEAWYRNAAHKIAHAVAGCAAAAAGKNKCQDGAIGAAVGEIVGEALVNNTDFRGMTPQQIAKEKAKIVDYAKLAAGTVVGVTGGDVNAAAQTAQTAVEKNTLYPKCAPTGVGNSCRKAEAEALETALNSPHLYYKEYLSTPLGFVPVIGDIQSFVEAQTTADYLFATLGVLPGVSEARQAYKVAEAAKDLTGMKNALNKAAVIGTEKGYISKTKIQIGKTDIPVTTQADKHLLDSIAKGSDKTGKATEQLFDSLAKQNGFKVIQGGKYGGNKGFDHVWVARDGSVVVIVESKQIKNGTVQLNSKGTGGFTQMSEPWIVQVLNSLPNNDPAKKIILEAYNSQKLKTAVAGVDRQTGKAVILPVNIPSKHNIRR